MTVATAFSDTLPASSRHRILFLEQLSLSHFRNYNHARMEINAQPVILTGRNGAGKTNILEAISFLLPGRGLRRARLSDLDNCNAQQPWAVSALLHGMQGDVRIGTGRDPETPDDNDKRIVRIDNKTMRGQADLARHLALLWLTPQMEQLFQEGASSARKFLDRLTYSFDPEHASRINNYDYAMRERNRLLQYSGDTVWLTSLEHTMAETGAAIAIARLHTTEHINHAIRQSELSFPKAHIAVTGFMENRLQQGEASVMGEEAFKQVLHDNRAQDAAAARTLIGIHRSELRVTHIEKAMPAESCSTGEQKAMLLSITLAQARAGAMWHGIVPVLLLDEVVAHLDPMRRLELFDEIRHIGAQTWMTGTDISLFEGIATDAQCFHVENGAIN